MIDRVYLLNLPHRTDRKYFMLGHLETINVPYDRLCIFEAKDGNDYETTGDVIDAAVADGFDFFSSWEVGQTRTQLAYKWNWCLMLREIMELQIHAFILLDDRILTVDWETLCSFIEFLNASHPPFHILQVEWRHDDDSIPYEIGKHGEPVNEFIAKGTYMWGDFMTVVSPAGAERMFNSLRIHPNTEGMFHEWQNQGQDQTGLFHCIKPLNKAGRITHFENDINHFYKNVYS